MAEKKNKWQRYLTPAVLIFVVFSLGVGGYFYYSMTEEINQDIKSFEETILNLEDENIALARMLKEEQQKNQMFESQIGQIAGTVGNLNKLAKTDKELLQKYSKVYFLNENYKPKGLIEIPRQYIYEQNKKIQILASTSPHLLAMIGDAKGDGADLLVISSFRSFGDQSFLKDNYKLTYGSGANQFSADQGYSEHQLGTTVDFTSLDLGAAFTGFGKSKEYEWLLQNAYRYGFTLSYPKDNLYYQHEPWHWRFVGRKLAKRLHEEKQNFYDLEQRQIDPYLINIFD